TAAAISVDLRPLPDLIVGQVIIPERATAGQLFSFQYQVVNLGGDTPPRQGSWTDSVYLSRDPVLDPTSDRFITSFDHSGGFSTAGSYTISGQARWRKDLIGAFYVFVVSDAFTTAGRSSVFEAAGDQNNARASAAPLLIEQPPPSDLVVDTVTSTAASHIGDP